MAGRGSEVQHMESLPFITWEPMALWGFRSPGCTGVPRLRQTGLDGVLLGRVISQ